jgi:anti-sigma factor RsiW
VNCERVRLLVDAYATGELDLPAALDVEEHLKGCGACAGALESVRALRQTLGGASLRYAAPDELRRRVLAATDAGGDRHRPAPRLRIGRFAPAAAVAALLLLPWLGLFWKDSRSSAERFAADVTSGHVRSLMSDHLLDVPSTDQHTVKPWFTGKLDFSPTVVDLTADGFTLAGGRLDYVNDRPVAAIVYLRRKHVINLFTWPSAAADQRPSPSRHNGYNLIAWARDGMACVAVSDLSPQELRQFVELLRPGPGPATRP